MEHDYDIDERTCPKCGGETLTTPCNVFDCENGWVTEDDGVNEWPPEKCTECHGRGFHWWCPTCGDCER